jgi:hypothetical protein
VSTINIGLTVTPAGTNIVNPRLTYYIKAVDGLTSGKVIEATNYTVPLGVQFSNSTGNINIDTHLQSLGLSTTSDHTITYHVYCRLTAEGAVSGETLTAEIAETQFTQVTFDYGVVTIDAICPSVARNDYDGTINGEAASYSYARQHASFVTDYNDLRAENTWDVNNMRYRVSRAFLTLDTTAIPDNAVIQSAQLSLHCQHTGFIGQHFDVIVQGWTGYPPLDTDDYTAFDGVTYGSKYTSTFVSGTWSNITLTNLDLIKKDAFTAICLRSSHDVDAISPSRMALIVFDSANQGYSPRLYVTYKTENWNLSWNDWVNSPLSLISVPVARQLVSAVLFGFAFVLLLTLRKNSTKGKAKSGRRVLLWLSVFALIFIALSLLLQGANASVTPTLISEKWQAGEQAIHLFSFPFASTVVENDAVIEKPATIHGDLAVTLAAWNITSETPLKIALDGEDVDTITSEGYYTLSYKLASGTHSITLYSDLKVFEQATFYVEPAPPPPPTVPLTEFLEKLEEQRDTIVVHMLLAGVAGVPLGIWTKKKTLLFTAWVMPLPASLMLAGYVWMPDVYFLLPFGATYALAYYLCPNFAKRRCFKTVTSSQAGMPVEQLETVYVDEKEQVIDAISPRYWREGFIHKRQMVTKQPAPFELRLDGESVTAQRIRKRTDTDRAILLEGDPEGLALERDGSNALIAMANRYAKVAQEKLALEHALPALVADGVLEAEKLAKTGFERLVSTASFFCRAKAKLPVKDVDSFDSKLEEQKEEEQKNVKEEKKSEE